MSNTPEPVFESQIESESETENVVGDDTVTIHRAPRYLRFMIAGAVVGLIAALVLTLAFPEPPGFDYSQVFGFLALFFVVAGFALGAVVALLVDRASRRAAKTIRVELIEGGDAEQASFQPGASEQGSAELVEAPPDADPPASRAEPGSTQA